MGVPAFYRWLSQRYPKIIIPAIEDAPVEVDGVPVPVDYKEANPNGELDNLYLDMNGIVHPCTHPEGRPAPENEDEMMLEVFRFTDHVLSIAKPRKVLMMAVDGVAPRAKMNQQRSRRFRSVQDAKIAEQVEQKKLAEAERRGEIIDDAIKNKRKWDTNVITPGTPFMDFLATALRYWTAYKLNTDPGWKDLKVIISDASVPGEGEHKLMEFIRSQRCDPQYDPNTSHCIYGLDADLIFLGLATHEPHFRVLREDVFQQNRIAGGRSVNHKPHIWLDIGILRQYLNIELNIPGTGFVFDLERAIDDWVFMAFFCGNDFLPHLPSLDVRENGLDVLLRSWRANLHRMHGYITTDGEVDLKRAQTMIEGVAKGEDGIFKRKHIQELRREANERQRREQNQRNQQSKRFRAQANTQHIPAEALENMPMYTASGESVGTTHMTTSDIAANKVKLSKEQNNVEAGHKRSADDNEDDDENDENDEDEEEEAPEDVPEEEKVEVKPEVKEEILVEDNVKTWEPGYRDRYYRTKFHVNPKENREFVRKVVHHYIEGVCWTLKYYYQGCPSWTWYYPYHYAPFAQDMAEVDIGTLDISFQKNTRPFLPFEQLMSVLPAASSHTLPAVFRPLMSSPESPIIDFYPVDFPIDMNGKKMSWQGIALLPFIDEKRLLEAVQAKYPELTENEAYRNSRKEPVLLVAPENGLRKHFARLYEAHEDEPKLDEYVFQSKRGNGLAGIAHAMPSGEWSFERPLICPVAGATEFRDLPVDMSVSVEYEFPEQTSHKSMLLQGTKEKDLVLGYDDEEAILARRSRSDRGDDRPERRFFKGNQHQSTEVTKHERPRLPGGWLAFLDAERQRAVSGGYVDPYYDDQRSRPQNRNQYQNRNQNWNQNPNQGYQGYQGYQGHQGYQGYQGQGYQGYQGQGYQGQGYQGQGYQGQGYQGQGYQGYQGQGYQNYQGYQSQGYQGYQGQNQQGQNNYQSNHRNQGYNGYNRNR